MDLGGQSNFKMQWIGRGGTLVLLAEMCLYAYKTVLDLYNDAQLGSIRAIRRMPHHGRSVTGTRARRGNMQFQTTGAATLPVLSPGGRDRELMDPIAGH